MLKQAAIVVFVSIALAALNAWLNPSRISWNPDAPGKGEIGIADALKLQDEGRILWVDACTRKEYDQRHIPGAILLNEDEWEGLLGDFIGQWSGHKTIVVYCQSSGCQASHHVAKRIREELLLEKVFALRRGWTAWLEAKGEK